MAPCVGDWAPHDQAYFAQEILADLFKSHGPGSKPVSRAKDGQVYLNVVTKPANAWCDWSLHAFPGPAGASEPGRDVGATVESTRSKKALHVNHLDSGETTLLGKIPWDFLDEEDSVFGEGDGDGDVRREA
ncbi:hypothetical protein SCAR479_00905 [Seiridium cardinale]|uniref:Uncharacterized protein n=1 Tax=Seiridium cardinale TaxID=138064 RepID=A0ABR2Y7F9_9PEZI